MCHGNLPFRGSPAEIKHTPEAEKELSPNRVCHHDFSTPDHYMVRGNTTSVPQLTLPYMNSCCGAQCRYPDNNTHSTLYTSLTVLDTGSQLPTARRTALITNRWQSWTQGQLPEYFCSLTCSRDVLVPPVSLMCTAFSPDPEF